MCVQQGASALLGRIRQVCPAVAMNSIAISISGNYIQVNAYSAFHGATLPAGWQEFQPKAMEPWHCREGASLCHRTGAVLCRELRNTVPGYVTNLPWFPAEGCGTAALL